MTVADLVYRPRPQDVSITRADSQVIDLCRVLAIFFMLPIHMPPGWTRPSALWADNFELFSTVWVDWLARGGVPALSVIGGFLLAQKWRQITVPELAVRRSQSLLLPMVVWGGLFLLLGTVKHLATGGGFETSFTFSQFEGPFDVVAWLLNLSPMQEYGPLQFLRDLFVVLILVRIAMPLIERAPLLVLACVTVISVFDAAHPLVLRPAILFFVTAGAAVAALGLRPTDFGRAPVALTVIGLGVAAFLLVGGDPNGMAPPDEATNLARRVVMATGFLWLATQMVRYGLASALLPIAPMVYLTYLSHQITLGMVYQAWRVAGLTEFDTAYVGLFAVSGLFSFAAAWVLWKILDHCPGWLCIALGRRPARG